MTEIRYMLACARLASLSDVAKWSPQDLVDVMALVNPSVSMEEWARRSGLVNPPAPAPAVEDPETSATMEAILNGAAEDLKRQGILEVSVTNG